MSLTSSFSNRPRRSVAPTNKRGSATLKVCVVDPRPEDYAGWESNTHAGACQITIVPTAEAALRLARMQAIDLWVVNVALEGLSGPELCGMLKARDARTPVYLVADEYSPDAERAAWRARATLFGCKPGHSAWLDDWLGERVANAPPNVVR